MPEFRLASHQGSHHATLSPGNHPLTLHHGTLFHAAYPKVVGFQQATSASSEGSLTSCDTSSDATSDSDTLSTLPDDSKIPKPQGKHGHFDHGGYTLESTLDWNHNVYVRSKASFISAWWYIHLLGKIRPSPIALLTNI